MRRLRRPVELRGDRAGRDRVRPQARDRPVELQQGLLLPQGLLPELRHRPWRTAEGRAGLPDATSTCPSRRCRRSTGNYAILVTGVGGTGVVTIGALIAMAAHLDGKGAGVIDMAGLAQKGGAVTTPCPASRRAPATSRRSASPPAAPTCCSAATWWSPARREALAAIVAGRDARLRQYATRPIRAISPAMPISPCRRGAILDDDRDRAGAGRTP